MQIPVSRDLFQNIYPTAQAHANIYSLVSCLRNIFLFWSQEFVTGFNFYSNYVYAYAYMALIISKNVSEDFFVWIST